MRVLELDLAVANMNENKKSFDGKELSLSSSFSIFLEWFF